MGIYTDLSGLLEVELVSANMEGTFDAIMSEGIGLYSVRSKDELTSIFVIRRSDLILLQELTKRRGELLTICEKRGIYWKMRQLVRRPVLIIGAMLLFLLTIMIPTRILFLRVEGNTCVSDLKILEAAENIGICFGAKRESIRSEHVKNKLLAMIPELEWAGVNTRGCVAYINVRERSEHSSTEQKEPGSIVASRDGIISSITVSEGTPMCTVGEAVMEGQLLISGYTDCGITLLSGSAQGEVYAYTSRKVNAVFPQICDLKGPVLETRHTYSIVIGKNRINLWKGSGICPSTCDRIYERYYFTLPGGATLPLSIIKESVLYYELSSGETSNDGLFMAEFVETCLNKEMTAGKILFQNTELTSADGVWVLDGYYGCLEMIGRSKREEIGEMYG